MPTVTRVLPWRRHTQPPAMEVQEIIAQFRRFHPKRSTDVDHRVLPDGRRAPRGSAASLG